FAPTAMGMGGEVEVDFRRASSGTNCHVERLPALPQTVFPESSCDSVRAIRSPWTGPGNPGSPGPGSRGPRAGRGAHLHVGGRLQTAAQAAGVPPVKCSMQYDPSSL